MGSLFKSGWPVAIVLLVVACTATTATMCPPVTRPTNIPTSAPSPAPAPSATPAGTGAPGACFPTDQDQYVYNPNRLTVLQACVHMTGTVAAIRTEADGDEHILIKPDPAYASLVNAANSGLELGDLVNEPVCINPVTQADAVATCGGDKDPLSMAGLAVGQHVWFEGRYVNDGAHGGWAELHPVYRWGFQTGIGVALPSQTPPPINDEAP